MRNLRAIKDKPEDAYVIHLACGPNGNESHFSSRIYSIYAKNLNSSSSYKFSIERYASKNGISLSDIQDWYDDLEIGILDDFNNFLKTNAHCVFFYWSEDGQELILDSIKSRFEEINRDDTNKAFHSIPLSNRVSLQFMNTDFLSLREFVRSHNEQQIIPGFLNNAEEVICFDRKEFEKISHSITIKVDFFLKRINSSIKNEKGKLEETSVDLEGLSLKSLLSRLSIKSYAWIIGSVIGLFLTGFYIGNYNTSQSEKMLQIEINTLKNQQVSLVDSFSMERKSFSDSLSFYKRLVAK